MTTNRFPPPNAGKSKFPPPTKEAFSGEVGPTETVLLGGVNDAFFNLPMKGGAALSALAGYGKYDDILEYYRQRAGAGERQNPKAAMAKTAIGVAAPMAFPMVQGPAFLNNLVGKAIAKGVTTGGTYGLLSGLGTKDTDVGTTIGHTISGAGLGGITTGTMEKLLPDLGSYIYSRPFKKIDAATTVDGEKGILDYLKSIGFKGSYQDANKLLQDHLENYGKTIEDVLKKSGKMLDPTEELAAIEARLPMRMGSTPENAAVKSWVRQNFEDMYDKRLQNLFGKDQASINAHKKKLQDYLKNQEVAKNAAQKIDPNAPPAAGFGVRSAFENARTTGPRELPTSEKGVGFPRPTMIEGKDGMTIDGQWTRLPPDQMPDPSEIITTSKKIMPLMDLFDLKVAAGRRASGGGFATPAGEQVKPDKKMLKDVYGYTSDVINNEVRTNPNTAAEATKFAQSSDLYSRIKNAEDLLRYAAEREAGGVGNIPANATARSFVAAADTWLPMTKMSTNTGAFLERAPNWSPWGINIGQGFSKTGGILAPDLMVDDGVRLRKNNSSKFPSP